VSDSEDIDDVEAARRIRAVLLSHRGAARAITAPEIAKRIGIHDPEGTRVRTVIRRELELLMALFGNGRGYFLPQTGEEVERGFRTLYSRIRKTGRRTVVIRRLLLAEGWSESTGRVTKRKWTPPPERPGREASPGADVAAGEAAETAATPRQARFFDDSPWGFAPQDKRR